MPRYIAKSDGNQQQLVDHARRIGFSVDIVHRLPGLLDLIVGIYGLDQRVEVKDPRQDPSKRKLTDAEQRVFDEWRGRPPVVWETEQDVEQTRRDMMIANGLPF